MGGFNLFEQIFTKIDAVTASFVTAISGNIISTVMPVITAGLTISFILYGLLVARGVVDHSLKDFFFKCFKIGVIVSIASAGGLYQTQIANAIQKTPDEFAVALLPASADAGQAQGGEAASVVDNAAKAGFAKAEDAFDKASIFHPGSAFVFALYGTICILATAVLVAVGGAFIILAKVALALLAGLGPLFILALLFKATSRFFEAWCGQVLTYGLLVLLVSSVFGLMMQIFTNYMDNMAFDGVKNVAMELGGCVILSIACILIVIQLPTIAGSLANGVGIGLWHELRVAAGIGGKSVGAAAASVRGGVAAGQAAYSGGKAAASAIGRAAGRFRGSARAA